MRIREGEKRKDCECKGKGERRIKERVKNERNRKIEKILKIVNE